MNSLTLWDYALVFGSSFGSAVLVVAGFVLWFDNRERGQ